MQEERHESLVEPIERNEAEYDKIDTVNLEDERHESIIEPI